jgi:CBS-domain-containing membrane protein
MRAHDAEPDTPPDAQHPIGGQLSDVVGGLARRLRLPALERRHNSTAVLGAFGLVNGFVSIALMAAAAAVTRQPFLFPSLGPTAFLLFYTPRAASACPRNTLAGHLIGVLAGYGSLAAFGLTDAGPAGTHVTAARIGAAALSLGVTAGAMAWLRVPHPPAGATTLIISLGLLTRPAELAVLMLAVLFLAGQGIAINRFAGIDYPLWAPRPRQGAGQRDGGNDPPAGP